MVFLIPVHSIFQTAPPGESLPFVYPVAAAAYFHRWLAYAVGCQNDQLQEQADDQIPRLRRAQRRPTLATLRVRTALTGRRGCEDRHSLLRSLPFRPAYRTQ